jgi:hypothetical protein
MLKLLINACTIVGGLIIGWITFVLAMGFITLGAVILFCLPFLLLFGNFK